MGKRHHFPCECGGWHYLLVVDDDDPDWRCLEIADTYAPRRWGERVGAAWLCTTKPQLTAFLGQPGILHQNPWLHQKWGDRP